MNVKRIIDELKTSPDNTDPLYIYDCVDGNRIPVCEIWQAMNGSVQVGEVGNAEPLTVSEAIEEFKELDFELEVMYGNIPVNLVDLSIEGTADFNIN